MRPLVVACAFAASTALFALELCGEPAWSLAPASSVGWVTLCWCAALSFAGHGPRAWPANVVAAAFLPVLALGAAADLRAGAPRELVSVSALSGLAVFAAWSFALERAARSARGAKLGLLVWGVLTLGLPLGVAALQWGAADEAARAPAWFAACASASPLAWSYELTARALGAGWRAVPFAPLGAAALLFAAGRWCSSKERA